MGEDPTILILPSDSAVNTAYVICVIFPAW